MICCQCKTIHPYLICSCKHKKCEECDKMENIQFYLNIRESEEWREIRKSMDYQQKRKMGYFEIDSDFSSKWNFFKVRLFWQKEI